jgi:hypothetical protein
VIAQFAWARVRARRTSRKEAVTHRTIVSSSPNRRRDRLGAESNEGRRALRLVSGGLAFAVLCGVLNAWTDVSIGQLHVIAALALGGLLVVVAGGVVAVIAIAHGDRSGRVLGTFCVSLFALLVIVVQFALDVP